MNTKECCEKCVYYFLNDPPRCKNKSCECHTVTVEERKGSAAGGLRAGQFISTPTSNGIEEVMPEAGWKKEWDELWNYNGCSECSGIEIDIDKVEAFIQQQIDKAREEGYATGLLHGVLRGTKDGHTAALSRIQEEVDAKHIIVESVTPDKRANIIGYNAALTDIKAIISKIREEYGTN